MSSGEPRYWHVIVQPQDRRKSGDDAVVVDQDRAWVTDRIIEPRRRGDAIVVAGRQFEWSEIERIRITASDEPSERISARLRAEDERSSVAFIGGPSVRHRAAARAQDFTDALIDTPVRSVNAAPASVVDRKKVMVVHGRDGAARRSIFDFLRALGLAPQEWGELVAATGSAAPYIGQVLDRAFAEAAAVVVLFTPDDEARLRAELQSVSEPEHERELTPQARPNVLLEAGMALGIHPDRTVLVELGRLRPFSDIYGRHVVRLDGSERPLRDITARLRTAGCEVDTTGSDWADPSRFPNRIVEPDGDGVTNS